MDLLKVPNSDCGCELILTTPNRNEILKDGPPLNFKSKILGRGAYGTVFKAVFRDKQVAVKVVNNAQDTMQNEAHLLSWQHQNIVEILKVESTPNFGIVIMERFPGQCLQIILDSIELPLWHSVSISLDIISALAYCHKRNLLHLDVKPQNVLVAFNSVSASYKTHQPTADISKRRKPHNRRYVCKLCDFGSSMWVHEQSSNNAKGSARGTVRYMSPEALKEEILCPSADIYSFGITMWQIKHRQLPYSSIKCNEIVAYQVVKNNLRPDLNVASIEKKTLAKTAVQSHRNCLCEHYSTEVSFRSLEHIKIFLNRSETRLAVDSGFQTSYEENHKKNKELAMKKRILPLLPVRSPFKNLSSRQSIRRGLHFDLDGLRAEFRSHGKENKSPVSSGRDEFNLQTVFAFGTSLSYEGLQAKADLYKNLYVSCWNSDRDERPNALQVQRNLKNIFNI